MKKILTLLFFCLAILFATAQSSNYYWSKDFGGSMYDVASSVKTLSNGNIIVAGSTNSTDGDIEGNHGKYDVLLMLLDSSGNLLWQKCYGGSNDDQGYDVKQTSDRGFIVVGTTSSNDGDVSGNHGSQDVWVLKTDASGNLQNQRCLGGSLSDVGNRIIQDSNGNYIVAAGTSSTDDDVTVNYGEEDAWFVKLDKNLQKIWDLSYGDYYNDYGADVIQKSDSNYLFDVYTEPREGDGSSSNNSYYTVTKNGRLVSSGVTNSQSYFIEPKTVIERNDRTLVFAGQSSDYNSLGTEFFAAKSDYTSLWHYGYGLGEDHSYSLSEGILMRDNGILAAGYSTDGLIYRLDSNGKLQWRQAYGGSSSDAFTSLARANDGSVYLAGYSYSQDGDLPGNKGAQDLWILKLKPSFDACNPATPINITSAITAVPTDVKLSWTPVDNPNSFKIQYKSNGQQYPTVTVNDPLATSHTLSHLQANTTYYWRIREVCGRVKSGYSARQAFTTGSSRQEFSSEESSINVFPNPFTQEATIQFSLEKNQNVLIQLFDITGRNIKTITSENFPEGNHELELKKGNLNAGIYFLQLKTSEGITTKKILIQ